MAEPGDLGFRRNGDFSWHFNEFSQEKHGDSTAIESRNMVI
jgi:hypothetical protein